MCLFYFQSQLDTMAFPSVPTENDPRTHAELTRRLYLENPMFVDVQYSDVDFYPCSSVENSLLQFVQAF